MGLPPNQYETQRQIQLMQAVICAYIVENVSISNEEDALEVAHRLHNVGFVIASSTVETEQNLRLDRIEDRVMALEAWAGVPQRATQV